MAKILRMTLKAMSMMFGRGDIVMSAEHSKKWDAHPEVYQSLKALIDPGSTSNPSWGGALSPINTIESEFLEAVRPATIVGRMLGFRPAVFNVRMPMQTGSATVGWVGQGMPAPAGSLAFDEITMMTSKLGGIIVVSDELVRSSDPSAAQIIQNDLIAATSQFTDGQLLDPSIAEIADVSPASITHDAPTFPSTGDTMDNIEEDLKLLVSSLNDAGVRFTAPYWVMKPSTALHLATLRDIGGGGQPLFPGMGVKGGSIWGIPVLVSANVPVDAETPNASYIVLVDAAEMLLAEGGIELDSSKQASVQLRTDPQTGAQTLFNLFQRNQVGTRITRFIRWQMRRAGAVAVLSGVNY